MCVKFTQHCNFTPGEYYITDDICMKNWHCNLIRILNNSLIINRISLLHGKDLIECIVKTCSFSLKIFNPRKKIMICQLIYLFRVQWLSDILYKWPFHSHPYASCAMKVNTFSKVMWSSVLIMYVIVSIRFQKCYYEVVDIVITLAHEIHCLVLVQLNIGTTYFVSITWLDIALRVLKYF